MIKKKAVFVSVAALSLIMVAMLQWETISLHHINRFDVTKLFTDMIDTHLQNTGTISEVSTNTSQGHIEAKPPDIISILKSIRLCTQSERISHMKKICEKRYDVAQFKDPVGRSLVDHKHQMTFCWMSKSGGTSLKAFILEASGLDLSNHDRQEDSLNMVHFVETVNKYGLQQMYQLNKTQQVEIVNKYFNVMGIRHPFDRLVAYYRDKIVDTDRSSNHPGRVKEILKEFRPDVFARNKTLSDMEWPQEELGVPTFGETMTWIYRHKLMDEHWNFISDICHPCAHDWGAILRVETMENDGHLLAKIVNSTHDGIPVRHSHQHNVTYSDFGKHLSLFSEVPDDVIDYFLEFYRTDLMTFGYRWDRESHTAYCSIDTPTGPCC